MSIFLFCVGAIAFLAGVVMAGFGVPVSEFSFGNTLITAGATTAVGGLIVIGLGAVVSKLRHIADALGTQAPIHPGRPLDMYEAAADSRAAAASGRIPFPPKPKPAASMREPQPLAPRVSAPAQDEPPIEEQAEQSFAPTFAPILPNPDEPPMTVEDAVSLSPEHPVATPGSAVADLHEPPPPAPPVDLDKTAETRDEPMLESGWRAPPPFPSQSQSAAPQTRQHSSYFDTMWPPETRFPRAPAASEAKAEPELDLPPPEVAGAPEPHEEEEPEAPPPRPANEPRAVAILKSGVVDGMAYTLYVDGSIEAELPQGTLHFASINELRSHLENNS